MPPTRGVGLRSVRSGRGFDGNRGPLESPLEQGELEGTRFVQPAGPGLVW